MRSTFVAIVLAGACIALAGCEYPPSREQVGTAAGAAAGGAAGHYIGDSPAATVGGAAAGAIIGKELTEDEQETKE